MDRPAQFASIRTDMDLNIIGEPDVFYCQPAEDYLPQPEAVLITGITPQKAASEGLCEAEFALRIHRLFSQPGTCVVGYNNVRFDDEVTRHIFYRNFLDPYDWSWQNGNSRWDLLDVMRACYALRPHGIHWPANEDGMPAFRLEQLTKANGIDHAQAHDAMSDVLATIAMAKQVKQHQPKLFHYLLSHRRKQKVMSLINIPQTTPLVHISGMFGGLRSNTSLIAPLAWHPDNRNALITCDLAGDMTPLLELDADALRERLYTRQDALDGRARVPLKLVHINKCPVLAPLNALRAEDVQRIGLDRQRCFANLAILQQHPQVREKVLMLFAERAPFVAKKDVDAQLYQGFFSEADKAAIAIIRQADPRHLPAMNISFSDERIEKLLFRYRARNFPGTLDEPEQQRWLQHRRDIFTPERLQHYFLRLADLSEEYQQESKKSAHLRALADYARLLAS